MFHLPGPTERIAIVGMNGSGKTQAGAWIFAQVWNNKSRWIILDYKRDELLNQIRAAEEIGLKSLPKQPGIYITHPIPGEEDDVEEFLWQIWNKENTGVFVDEGYMLGRSKAFQALLTQGRSKKIPMIILSQRPAFMTRFVWSEANYHQIFYLGMDDDRKRVREFVSGYDPNLELPKYHSFYHDVVRRKLYVATPAPDAQSILDFFDEKSGRRVSFV